MGDVLGAGVSIVISTGLTSLNNLVKQATVRRNVVVQLIRMQLDATHPDCNTINMRDAARRAAALAPTLEEVNALTENDKFLSCLTNYQKIFSGCSFRCK